MRQVLKNGESPVDWTDWPVHDANWALSAGNFVGTCDGTTAYFGQSFGLQLGDVVTLEYSIVSDTIDGSLVMSGASAFGGGGLVKTVGEHTVDYTVVNGAPTEQLYIAVTGGTTGAVTIGYIRLYVNGEMLNNSEAILNSWGW